MDYVWVRQPEHWVLGGFTLSGLVMGRKKGEGEWLGPGSLKTVGEQLCGAEAVTGQKTSCGPNTRRTERIRKK